MIQIKLAIVSNERLSKYCWRMTLEGFPLASEIKPGQFINIKILEGNDPLFRRPFSVFRHRQSSDGYSLIDVVYEVVGRGTRIMSYLEPGDELDVIGPLGHGFEWNRDKKVHVIIGGGIGCAGLFLLGEELSQAVDEYGLELYTILDFKRKDRLILEEDFITLKGKVLVSTHDGSYGYHGYVTEMLRDYIEGGKISPDCALYACGPELMYKALAPICKQYHISTQISIERHMMCGLGACLSCVCKVNKSSVLKYRDLKTSHIQFVPEKEFGYALTCKDGPVFHIDEMMFDE